MPSRKPREKRVLCTHHNHRAMKSGAMFGSSVALATVVRCRETCQTPMSAAKKKPASSSTRLKSVRRPAARSRLAEASAQIHSSGAASAMRQNAEATGLTSDRRIMMPAKPMAAPPSRRAQKARTGNGFMAVGVDSRLVGRSSGAGGRALRCMAAGSRGSGRPVPAAGFKWVVACQRSSMAICSAASCAGWSLKPLLAKRCQRPMT